MRTQLMKLLLLFPFLFIACTKKQRIESSDKAKTIYISGLEEIVRFGNYDSVSIPIEVYSSSGGAEPVTLSWSFVHVPMRMRAVLTDTAGTTPFKTTLKLYTYFTANKHPDPKWGGAYFDMFVHARTANGEEYKYPFLFDTDIEHCGEMFYQFYFKDTNWVIRNISNSYLAPGPGLHLDPATGEFYLTNLYLGVYNGKTYYSPNDVAAIDNNINQSVILCESGMIILEDTVVGYSSVDTGIFYINPASINYYRVNRYPDTTYNLGYGVQRAGDTTQRKYFEAEGKLIF